MDQEENKGISFDLPKNRSNVIKVMGVGGGGSNAINYMFRQGIKGVDFIISNTDAQALSESGVPTKIQLGASLTEGLGAGANPEVGAKAAQESHEEIHSILSTQTKMIFITAGMGGGTGTGAAPIIAQMAKSMDILTVGIVTMPFQFEGKLRLEQAQKGLEKIKGAVDALIVINNNKLREVYGNLGFKAGFAKADEVLATAARGIAEVITHHYTQNIDLKDAKTVLTNSGTAIMGSGTASGSNRAQEAIVKALDSPLLNDNKITGCKNVLLLIVSGSDEITIDEIGEINDYIQTEAGNHTNIIMGVGEDETLGNEVSVTVIATGFGQEQQNEISNTEAKKIIHSLEDEQKVVHDLSNEAREDIQIQFQEPAPELDRNEFKQATPENRDPLIEMNELLQEIEVDYEVVSYPDNSPVQPAFETPEEPKALVRTEEPLEEEEQLTVSSVSDDDYSILKSTTEELESNLELNEVEPQVTAELDQEDETLSPPLDFDLTSSFFESQEEVVEEKTEPGDQSLGIGNELAVSDEETEFIFNEIEVKDPFEMEVIDPETLAAESQMQMEFEMPLKPKNQAEQVSSAEEVVPEDLFQDKTVKDFDDASLEIKFELKQTEVTQDFSEEQPETIAEQTETIEQSVSQEDPFNQSIDETLAAQNEKRKEHLKVFNHKFMHQMQRVDDMEKQPAYKRQGLDLDSDMPESPSRTTLDIDNNDDLQMRSNNSFLHDNVD
ncbi:MAG: cell division protein FtsZ [Flavobacteriaceae bacterium]|nr:cell division protein FtsZ [Flavobacteriaceae bacterium]